MTKAIYIDKGIVDWFVNSGHKKYQNRYLFCISLGMVKTRKYVTGLKYRYLFCISLGMVKTRKYVTGLKFQLILHTDELVMLLG